MEMLYSLAIGLAVTFFFLRTYLKNLSPSPRPAATPQATLATKTNPCPRCSKPIAAESAFCPSCGAALALWNVQRGAAVMGSTQPKSGKPKPVINATLCIGCGSCVDVCPETGTLELVNGKAILADADSCTGHAKCIEACPTSAITLEFGGVRQTMRVPRLRENFETNVADLFIVGELGGMGLIKTAINEGRIVMDHIRRRVEGSQTADGVYDVAIVGAGPAGLSASLTALEHGLKYVTIEQGDIASTIRQYPRHKFLMAEPIQMPLYGNLYVADGTKEALLSVWESIIANTNVEIHTSERVEMVRRSANGTFSVTTSQSSYEARCVVMAIGKRGTPRRLGITGESLPKVAFRLIEADSYENKNVLIVGGGDSAIEAALALSRSGKNHVTICHRSDSFARARERNQSMLKEAESRGSIHVYRKSHVSEIRRDSATISVDGVPTEVPNDYVFVMIGGEPPEEFLQKIGVEIVQKTVAQNT